MATPFYAAILGIMLIVFSMQIINARRQLGVGIGDSDNLEMMRYIRVQANFTEYVPIFLIMLGYAEINGLPTWAVNFFGTLFLAGRIMHAYSLLKHEEYDSSSKLIIKPKWRIRGMICTFITIGSLSIIILTQMTIPLINRTLF